MPKFLNIAMGKHTKEEQKFFAAKIFTMVLLHSPSPFIYKSRRQNS